MNKKIINKFDPFMPVKITNSLGENEIVNSNMDDFMNDFVEFATINDKLKISTPTVKKGRVVLLTKREIGDKGILGEKLLEDFIFSLSDAIELPQYLIFMNEAVMLFDNKNIYECISKMKKYGVSCLISMESMEQLKYFKKNKEITQVTSADITEIILFAEKVISL